MSVTGSATVQSIWTSDPISGVVEVIASADVAGDASGGTITLDAQPGPNAFASRYLWELVSASLFSIDDAAVDSYRLEVLAQTPDASFGLVRGEVTPVGSAPSTAWAIPWQQIPRNYPIPRCNNFLIRAQSANPGVGATHTLRIHAKGTPIPRP